jgi:hypothetical protein
VTTVTSTVPADSGGLIVEIDVAEFTVKVVADDPKYTAEVPRKFVPVMVTAVPPPNGPAVGAIADTVGAGTNV